MASGPSDSTTALAAPNLGGQTESEETPYQTNGRSEFDFPPEIEVFDDSGERLPMPPPGHSLNRDLQVCKGRSNWSLYAGGADGGQYGFHLSLNDGLEPGFFKHGLDEAGQASTDSTITQHHGSGLPLNQVYRDRQYVNFIQDDDDTQFKRTYSRYIEEEGTYISYRYIGGRYYLYKYDIDPFAQALTRLEVSLLGDVDDLMNVARSETGNNALTRSQLANQIRGQVSHMGLYLDKLAEKTPKARITCQYNIG